MRAPLQVSVLVGLGALGCGAGRAVEGGGSDETGPEASSANPGAAFTLDTFIHTKLEGEVETPLVVEFSASRSEATFECRMDDESWTGCQSPREFRYARVGARHLEVRAVLDDQVDESPASADFRLIQLRDYPNIAYIEAGSGWYDMGEGFEFDYYTNPSQLRPFYNLYPDDFDSVVLWTDFITHNASAFGAPLKNDVSGIGVEYQFNQPVGVGDYAWQTGSAGRLEGLAFMNGHGYWKEAVLDMPESWQADYVLNVLAQEFGHRWLAFPRVDNDNPTLLLDDWDAHWNWFVSLDAPSPMGYRTHPIEDHGDGSFTAHLWQGPAEYSSLDLYLMGLLPASEVPEFSAISVDGDDSFPWDLLETGSFTFAGEKIEVTIDDVVGALGERTPGVEESRKSFRQAFVVVVPPGQRPSEETLEWVESIRKEWEGFFHQATRGLGRVDTSLPRP